MYQGTISGRYITINHKKLINLCSNDYLGLSLDAAAVSTSKKKKLLSLSNHNNTQMQSSSRLVSGNDTLHNKLEKTLAKHKSQQNALVFPTGYMTNLGVITAMIQKGDTVFSDELNHASIIEACKLSRANISIYKHNDMVDLNKKIHSKKGKKNMFLITEGIFSMDGDFAKLDEITEIAQKNDMITILDDAHGDFAIGKDGKGTANYYGVAKKIDVYISSLSKGLGSFGGYVTSQNNVIDYCINKSKSFIYTSALPSIFVNHALARIKSNQMRMTHQKKLQHNTTMMIKGLKEIGYTINSQTHIIPLVIGNEQNAVDFARYLKNIGGVFAQPIRYPTVEKNKARIRISITAWLNDSDIQKSLNAFKKAGKKFRVI